ncbi:MAG: hypothetical protein ACJATT_004907 [Myxococcota bacterium]
MRTSCLLFLAACTVTTPTERQLADPVLIEVDAPRVSERIIIEDAESAAVTDRLVVWFGRDGDLYRRAPGSESELIERALGLQVAGAVDLEDAGVDGTPVELLLLNGSLWTWNGVLLRPSPLAQGLPGQITRLAYDAPRLWIETTDGLFRWSADALVEIRVGDEPVTRGFAVGGVSRGQSVIWVGTEDAIHAVPVQGGPVLVEHLVQVSAITADAYGLVWIVTDGELGRVSRDGELLNLGRSGVRSLVSERGSADVWIGADDGWWQVRGLLAAQLTTSPAGDPIALDPAGRLWTSDGVDLSVLAVDRPVVLTGLSRGNVLDLPSQLTVEPTDPELVDTVAIALDDLPIIVDETWSFTLDPASLEAGLHSLDIDVRYTDGDSRTQARDIFVGLPFDVTWDEHISALHEARCARCHTDSTETILADFASWQDRYSDIVEQVQSGAMPLTGTPLTNDELSLVVGWGNGGFLP